MNTEFVSAMKHVYVHHSKGKNDMAPSRRLVLDESHSISFALTVAYYFPKVSELDNRPPILLLAELGHELLNIVRARYDGEDGARRWEKLCKAPVESFTELLHLTNNWDSVLSALSECLEKNRPLILKKASTPRLWATRLQTQISTIISLRERLHVQTDGLLQFHSAVADLNLYIAGDHDGHRSNTRLPKPSHTLTCHQHALDTLKGQYEGLLQLLMNIKRIKQGKVMNVRLNALVFIVGPLIFLAVRLSRLL
ncbi:hypothetical protein CC80DRAFT_510727 [Byssothecium circinans]|uniref:Uncharacterized protein n=1 Tax=Byssothecium circinans TaxID=147558 RepID=A0A6A5TBU1_9PLEO|nr:hypothetical protein CC80DRAFT_510727 [Byssothecium circinans]